MASRICLGGITGRVNAQGGEAKGWAGTDLWAGRDEGTCEVLPVVTGQAGKRLAPMLGVLVPLLRRDNELDLADAETDLLVRMSAATIDRRLAPERPKLISRGRSHTKPWTLLKS